MSGDRKLKNGSLISIVDCEYRLEEGAPNNYPGHSLVLCIKTFEVASCQECSMHGEPRPLMSLEPIVMNISAKTRRDSCANGGRAMALTVDDLLNLEVATLPLFETQQILGPNTIDDFDDDAGVIPNSQDEALKDQDFFDPKEDWADHNHIINQNDNDHDDDDDEDKVKEDEDKYEGEKETHSITPPTPLLFDCNLIDYFSSFASAHQQMIIEYSAW